MCFFSLACWIPKVPYCHMRPALLYNIFQNYLTKCTIFGGKKVTDHKMCVLIFFTIFPILGRTERDMIKLYICLHAEVPLFLSDFSET